MNRRYISMPAGGSVFVSPDIPAGDKESRKTLFNARRLVEVAMARQIARTINDADLAKLKVPWKQ